ncbi:class I SAM-dependent methyltransferase [soil metagenome]
MGKLSLTGERTVPGVASENYWFRRHEAAYRHLGLRLSGGFLVEVGCGEGYGAAAFADRVDTVLAIDYDRSAVQHAASTYHRIEVVQANLAALPIKSGTADVVASLQVIEHVWDHQQFIAECARVLRPGGVLMLTTPNRLTISPGLQTPMNPFHTHEFTASELFDLVNRHPLSVTSVLGLHGGSRLAGLDREYAASGDGSLVAAQLAHPPEQWSAQLVADVGGVSADDFEVRDTATADCLDLILLGRRL